MVSIPVARFSPSTVFTSSATAGNFPGIAGMPVWHMLCSDSKPTTTNSGRSSKTPYMLGSIIWLGRSGQRYWYAIYPRYWRFGPGQPGNYIYAVETAAFQLSPLYIGQTSDLSGSFLEHDSDSILSRATHVCVHLNHYYYGAFGRLVEERDLIELWQPAGNRLTQSRTSRSEADLIIPTANH